MKNQDLFSSKDKSKILKCRLLQLLCGALRVKYCQFSHAKIDLLKSKCHFRETLFICPGKQTGRQKIFYEKKKWR